MCREEDFQQWSKKTEAFFAGVIKETEMMLEWAAEQPTEITTTAIDLELSTDTNVDRVVQNLEFVLQQMHTALMAVTSYEANDIVANSRKNPLEAWRRLQKRYDPTTGGRKRSLLRTIISPGRCSLLELQAGIERWKPNVARYEKKMKDKLDDEIKLAGLESLVLEELEKHLILKSNRLRTFEDVRLEVVTYVEAKFGLRIRDSKPSDTGVRGHQIPWMLMRPTLSRLAKEKSHRVHAMGVLSAVEHIFNETAMHARAQASNRLAKANRASHGPRESPQSHAKERVKRTMDLKSETSSENWNQCKGDKFRPLTRCGFIVNGVLTNGTTAGGRMNGMMTGVVLDGMKIVNRHMTHLKAHFHLKTQNGCATGHLFRFHSKV